MKNKVLKLYKLSKLVNTTGNLVYPLITYILLKSLNIEETYIGFCIMVVSIVKIPGIMLGGKLGDKYNHKIVAAIPLILCGITLIICTILLKNKYAVLTLMCLSKFISGVGSPSNVKIMDSLTSSEDRKSVFAQIYLITNVGTAIASLSGGIIYSYSVILVFLLDGITRLISGIILLSIKNTEQSLPEVSNKNYTYKRNNNTKENVFAYISNIKGLWGYILLTLLFIYIYSQYSYAIPLELDETFGNNSSQLYSVVLFVNCITVVFTTKFFEKVCKKIPVLKCVMLAFTCYLIGYGAYCFKINTVTLIVSCFIWSCGEVIFGINEIVYISEKVDKAYFARTISVYDSLQNIIIALSPMINSIFVVTISLTISWVVIVFLAFFGFLISLIMSNMNSVKIIPDMEG